MTSNEQIDALIDKINRQAVLIDTLRHEIKSLEAENQGNLNQLRRVLSNTTTKKGRTK